MPRRPRTPSYRRHKPSGQAVVTLNGRDHYLGRYDSAESREKYDRLVAEWLASGRSTPTPARPPREGTAADPTVGEILLAYLAHAEGYYRPGDGCRAHELDNLRDALRPVRALYGRTPALQFGPLALRAVREAMIRSGLARTTINARIHRVRRMFRWAASVEQLPVDVVKALETVEALAEGRSKARESPPVEPVQAERVEATLAHAPAPVAAMVRLQLLTGMRCSEVMRMRGQDLTPGEPNWEYRPARHKNAWRGHARVIPLGPRAQAIVREFLTPDLSAFLFSPRAAVGVLHARRRQARKSKPTPSELRRRADRPGRRHAARYDRRAYRQAIVRACEKAFPHPTLAGVARKDLSPEQRAELAAWRRERRWSPLRLRHTAATAIRAKYDLETAQTVLGHKKPDTTTRYAERDLARAHRVMAEIG
jgi:integrase